MAITTENYLKDLIKQKENLVSTLQECGVEASNDETFNTLVPKVKEIINAVPSYIISDSLTVVGDLSHDSLMSIINALKDFSLNKLVYTNVDYDRDNGTHPVEFGVEYSCSPNPYSDGSFELLHQEGDYESPDFRMYVLYVSNLDITNEEVLRIESFKIDEDGTLTLWLMENEDGESAKTLTIGATSLSKLTDEEKAIATNKGWVLA